MKRLLATILVTLALTACSPNAISVEEECSRYLGIEWSEENGATERLDKFDRCITDRDYRAELAYKSEGIS